MPIIPRASLLVVDIVQVGSTTPGSDLVVTVVGEIIEDDPALQPLGKMPRVAIRAQTNALRASPQSNYGIQHLAKSAEDLNKNADVMAEAIETLDERILGFDREKRYATFAANLFGAAAAGTNLTPWPPVSVAAWKPVEAWLTARTAPVGDDLLVDVRYSLDAETTPNAPVWASIFKAGDANKLTLADGANRRLKPWTVFV